MHSLDVHYILGFSGLMFISHYCHSYHFARNACCVFLYLQDSDIDVRLHSNFVYITFVTHGLKFQRLTFIELHFIYSKKYLFEETVSFPSL